MDRVHLTLFVWCFLLMTINVSWGRNESLPSYMKPCPLSLSRDAMDLCITENVNAALPYYIEGDSSKNIPLLDPLQEVQLDIQIRNPPLKTSVLNGTMYGLRNLDATASRIDFKTEISEFDLKIPNLILLGKYNAVGSFLFIPIMSRGAINITIVDLDLTVITQFSRRTMKDQIEHLRLSQVGVKVNNIGRASYYMDNLLPGPLNDELNQALNDDWEGITSEAMPSVTAAFSPMFKSVIGRILQPYPFSALFPAN